MLVTGQHRPLPPALYALEPVAQQHRNTHGIGDRAIMFVSLPILLQDLDADGQVFGSVKEIV